MRLFRVKIKYRPQDNMDTVSYAREMKILECCYNETPLLVVANDAEEILKNLFSYFKKQHGKTMYLKDVLRPESFEVTIVDVFKEEINGVKFSHGVNGISTFTWNVLLEQFTEI